MRLILKSEDIMTLSRSSISGQTRKMGEWLGRPMGVDKHLLSKPWNSRPQRHKWDSLGSETIGCQTHKLPARGEQ